MSLLFRSLVLGSFTSDLRPYLLDEGFRSNGVRLQQNLRDATMDDDAPPPRPNPVQSLALSARRRDDGGTYKGLAFITSSATISWENSVVISVFVLRLSYESILASHPAAKKGRVIIAHLGSGCSLAALRDGRPLNTSMGFTPSGGLMMSTRSGDLDPNVLIYLVKHLGYTYDELENLVNHESGLKGVSGLRGDMRQLLEMRHQFPAADLAIEMFCDGIRRQIGAYAADLGGLDRLIFTGGIGEGAGAVRRSVCAGLEHLGVYLADPELPAPGIISSPGSACTVAVVPSNEELMIARHCRKLVPCLQ